ncbi:hypothetical protein NBRGN_001_00070 [Nocardia brasiliensis NBRC 14402]|nr:hypothetical protein NBRGN_001_00070 [Nocardia brasiliensis NBRC 14402]
MRGRCGGRSEKRVNSRNGHRHRNFDTCIGTIDVAIPKLRSGSYSPDWLLERRKRAERALATVVATCYLLGVSPRRREKLVESLGVTKLSKPSGYRLLPPSSTLRSRRLAPAPSIKARACSSEAWLTTEDVARRFQVPVKTIAVWASTGNGLRYIKVGRYRRYRSSDIDAWEHARLTAERTRRAA